MKVGYARVSSVGQSLEIQVDRLKECEQIFKEKKSANGKREELDACLQFVRKGDSLVITKIDRLARSMAHLNQIVSQLDKKGVSLIVLDQNISMGGSLGTLMLNVLGAFAQFEAEIRAERQADGIAKALSNGVKFGAPRLMNNEQVIEIIQKRAQGMKIRELMEEYKLSKASIYRYLSCVPNLDSWGERE